MNSKYLTTTLIAALVVAVMFAALGQRPTSAQASDSPALTRTVSVMGTGTVAAIPDQATIQIGVRTQGKSAEEALTANNTRMESLLNALKRANIIARDIQTRDFSIWPQYQHSASGTSTITGYEVSNMVFITVRDLDNFGATLDAAVRAGSNEVQAIQFGFNDPTALLDEARDAAMLDAKRKAGELAGLAEVQLGAVVTISESGSVPPPVLMRDEKMMTMADAVVPIESGASTVSVNVQVTYELTQ